MAFDDVSADRLTLEVYGEYLRLEALGAGRSEDEQLRYRELGARYGLSGDGLTPKRVDELEQKRDSGETLTREEKIALDAAYRASKPWNRADWRFQRQAPKLSVRVFRRTLGGPRRSRGRGGSPRRVRRVGSSSTTRGSPGSSTSAAGDGGPEPPDVVASEATVERHRAIAADCGMSAMADLVAAELSRLSESA